MEKLIIIKVGGNIIDDANKLQNFLQQFANIESYKILVHGGGKIASTIGEKLGIKSNYINGRRITDEHTIDVVTMVYAGLINKKIVAQLQSLQCNAIGLSGADANIIPATKRPVREIDYGFVGDVNSNNINIIFLQTILLQNTIPVIAPITHNEKGILLNTNADTIAQEIAKAMSIFFTTTLIYSFEKDGLLMDVDDETSVIKHLNFEKFNEYKMPIAASGKAIITDGMLPKLENAFNAIQNGVSKVIIGNANQLQDLILNKVGTTISYA